MLSNRLAFAALAAVCIGAAAGGSYLATRQNVTPTPTAAVTTPAPAAIATAIPVQETEAVVAEARPARARAPLAAPSAAPAVKRNGTATRPSAPATERTTQAASSKTSDPLPALDRTSPNGVANNAPAGQSSSGAPATAVPAVEASARGWKIASKRA